MWATSCRSRHSRQFTFAGANSGDAAGFSVASAGDVNGATVARRPINDLLIGAPHFNSNAGAAYLVYGGTTLTTGVKNGLVDLSRLQITPIPTGSNADPTPPQGAVFVGAGTDQAGYTVSSAGSFNPAVDSLGDFMIGSPGGNGQAGRVNLFYGVSTGTINSTGQYTAGLIANATNPIALNNPTAALALTGVRPLSASFVGAGAGFRAGFSLSYVNPTHSVHISEHDPDWSPKRHQRRRVGKCLRDSGARDRHVSDSIATSEQYDCPAVYAHVSHHVLEQQPDWIR